jgi:cytochrome c-type biogenesis protein CcmH
VRTARKRGPSTSLRFAQGDGRKNIVVLSEAPKARRRRTFFLLAALLLSAIPALSSAWAVEPSEMLKDPALEARARTISRELRCVVCQNQSVDDSNAEVAHDIRRAVRERLVAGDTDRQVLDYMVGRYGDYVLLDPPFKMRTLILWLGTPLVLLLGSAGIWLAARRRPAVATPAPLSAEERARLDSLLAPSVAPSEAEGPFWGRSSKTGPSAARLRRSSAGQTRATQDDE